MNDAPLVGRGVERAVAEVEDASLVVDEAEFVAYDVVVFTCVVTLGVEGQGQSSSAREERLNSIIFHSNIMTMVNTF